MTKIQAVHQFYPVGQGLFAAGSVEFWLPKRRSYRNMKVPGQSDPAPLAPYRWVYDCGSSTSKRLVSNGIDKVKTDCAGARLDLLTLSHFHNDHINCVVDC
jgi:glyoxylase-like metal-dependent hydrolase (beta-lactamase superfamily II)